MLIVVRFNTFHIRICYESVNMRWLAGFHRETIMHHGDFQTFLNSVGISDDNPNPNFYSTTFFFGWPVYFRDQREITPHLNYLRGLAKRCRKGDPLFTLPWTVEKSVSKKAAVQIL